MGYAVRMRMVEMVALDGKMTPFVQNIVPKTNGSFIKTVAVCAVFGAFNFC